MGMVHEHNQYVVFCNICYEECGPFSDLEDALDFMENNNWDGENTSEGWGDYCPSCSEKRNNLSNNTSNNTSNNARKEAV